MQPGRSFNDESDDESDDEGDEEDEDGDYIAPRSRSDFRAIQFAMLIDAFEAS